MVLAKNLCGVLLLLLATTGFARADVPTVKAIPFYLPDDVRADLGKRAVALQQQYQQLVKKNQAFVAKYGGRDLPKGSPEAAEALQGQAELEAEAAAYTKAVNDLNRDIDAAVRNHPDPFAVDAPGTAREFKVADVQHALDTLPTFPAIEPKDVEIRLGQLAKRTQTSEAGIVAAEFVYGASDMLLLLSGKTNLACKLIIVGGKSIIAQEDAAYVYLVKEDRLYEQALGYLKDKKTCGDFTAVVRAIRERKPIPVHMPDEMLLAAQAILDPKLGNSGALIALDAMFSPEARNAALTQACIQMGADIAGIAGGQWFQELTKARKPAFTAGARALAECKLALRNPALAADRVAIEEAIKKANAVMASSYRLAERTSAEHAVESILPWVIEKRVEKDGKR
jgi:hypothetical protein